MHAGDWNSNPHTVTQVCLVSNEPVPQPKLSLLKLKAASNPRPSVDIHQLILLHAKVLEARRMKPWKEPVPAIRWPSCFLRTLILGKPSPSPTSLSRAGVRIMANILLTADSFCTVCEWHGLEPQFHFASSGTLMVPGHHQSLRVILQSRKTAQSCNLCYFSDASSIAPLSSPPELFVWSLWNAHPFIGSLLLSGLQNCWSHVLRGFPRYTHNLLSCLPFKWKLSSQG